MVFHLLDALKTGSAECLVRTVDTDVICVLIGKFHSLQEHCPQLSIWVAFGTGKKFVHLSINAIIDSLGKDKAVIVYHPSLEEASALHGKHGVAFQTSQSHFKRS